MSTAVVKKEEKRTNGKIVPHQPYSIFQKLQMEMNHLFEDATRNFGFGTPEFAELSLPCSAKIDVRDTGKDLVVTAEVPGVEMADLDITATKNYISIAGEKKAEKSEKEESFYHMEREYGFFRRVVHLPCEIQNDRVDAVFKNGVLTITLPKTKEAMEAHKQVTVKAG